MYKILVHYIITFQITSDIYRTNLVYTLLYVLPYPVPKIRIIKCEQEQEQNNNGTITPDSLIGQRR